MFLAILAVALCAAIARAHPALGTVVSIHVVQTPEGPFIEAVVLHDALAYALNDTSTRVSDPQMRDLVEGPREELIAALQDGRERFASGFTLLVDDVRLPLEVIRTPTVEDVDQWRQGSPAMPLPCKGEFVARAKLPPAARTLCVRTPEVFDHIILSVSVPGHEVAFVPVAAGEISPAFDVRLAGGNAAKAEPAVTRPPSAPDDMIIAESSRDTLAAPLPSPGASHASDWLAVGWRYVVLGFRHIVPEGHDHELFILGLFLLNTRLRDVLWQVTAFTIAHTCTLSLAVLGLVAAPSAIIEPIIAASIAFIAIENIATQRVSPWRPAVAFFFGLVHGMGFASGLAEIGLPPEQLATAIIGFNVGVEAGHLLILFAAYLTLGWWRQRSWYRAYVAIPLSVLIAAIALVWFVERVM